MDRLRDHLASMRAIDQQLGALQEPARVVVIARQRVAEIEREVAALGLQTTVELIDAHRQLAQAQANQAKVQPEIDALTERLQAHGGVALAQLIGDAALVEITSEVEENRRLFHQLAASGEFLLAVSAALHQRKAFDAAAKIQGMGRVNNADIASIRAAAAAKAQIFIDDLLTEASKP